MYYNLKVLSKSILSRALLEGPRYSIGSSCTSVTEMDNSVMQEISGRGGGMVCPKQLIVSHKLLSHSELGPMVQVKHIYTVGSHTNKRDIFTNLGKSPDLQKNLTFFFKKVGLSHHSKH